MPANREIRGRIFEAIAEKYPYLAEECQRQAHPDLEPLLVGIRKGPDFPIPSPQ